MMNDLITSFIIQSKDCRLPGIGRFRTAKIFARTDIVNKQIIPPFIEYSFTPREEKISDGLINYVAAKKDISVLAAQKMIKAWSSHTLNRLKNGEEVFLTSLGSLKKNESGSIFFTEKKDVVFYEPVPAERVIRKYSEHAVLVGDKETTSSAMNQLLNEEVIVKRNNWKVAASVLLALGLLLLFFYFYQHSFSFSAIGNQTQVAPGQPPATYTPR